MVEVKWRQLECGVEWEREGLVTGWSILGWRFNEK